MSFKRVPDEVFATWMPLSQALLRVQQVQGINAYYAIVRRLFDGLIESAAEYAVKDNGSMSSFIFIEREFWKEISEGKHLSNRPFWSTNDAEVSIYESGYSRPSIYRFYGIRIDPAGLQKMLPPRPAPKPAPPAPPIATAPADTPPPLPAASPAARHAGGRPRKDFWDDLWIALCAQIYSGVLVPKRQADIEKAMLDWASTHGHELSEQSARARARNLFAALNEDKN